MERREYSPYKFLGRAEKIGRTIISGLVRRFKGAEIIKFPGQIAARSNNPSDVLAEEFKPSAEVVADDHEVNVRFKQQ